MKMLLYLGKSLANIPPFHLPALCNWLHQTLALDYRRILNVIWLHVRTWRRMQTKVSSQTKIQLKHMDKARSNIHLHWLLVCWNTG